MTHLEFAERLMSMIEYTMIETAPFVPGATDAWIALHREVVRHSFAALRSTLPHFVDKILAKQSREPQLIQ